MDRDSEVVGGNGSSKTVPRRGVIEIWRGFGPSTVRNVFTRYEVLALAIGHSCGLLLTEDHRVYSFEPGNEGTSLGCSGLSALDVTLVSCLTDKGVIDVSCGFGHSAVVCRNGDLYVWGENSSGQCAVDSTTAFVESPSLVEPKDFLHSCPIRESLVWSRPKVREVSCGTDHTLAVTVDGRLWTWGKGITDEDVAGRHVPRKVLLPKGVRACHVACGSDFSLAVVCKEATPTVDLPLANETTVGCASCQRISSEAAQDVVCSSPDHCPFGLPVQDPSLETSSATTSPSRYKDKSVKDEENAARLSSDCFEDCAPSESNSRLVELVTNDAHSSDATKRVSSENSEETYPEVLSKETDSIGLDSGDKCSYALVSTEREPTDVEEEEDSYVVLRHKDAVETMAATTTEESPSKQHQQSTKLSLTDSLRQSVGLLDVQSVTSFLSRQLTNVSESLYYAKGVVAPIKDMRTSPKPPSLAQATNDCVEKFSFVSKLNWAAESSSSETLHDVELSSFDSHSADHFDHKEFGTSGHLSFDSCSLKLHRRKSLMNKSNKVCSMDGVDRLAGGGGGGGIESCPSFSPSSPPHPSFLGVDLFRDNSEVGFFWDSEVWSWGRGNAGQLGLGDCLDRSKPTCISLLNGLGVVKVAAGHSHCLALTATGRVFAWGSDSHGQLGLSTKGDVVYSPTLINLSNNVLVQDVAVGRKHSTFLVNGCGGQCIYVVGKQEGPMEKAECMKTSDPIPHKLGFKDMKIRGICAGGSCCGCLIDSSVPANLGILYELANTELQFFVHLNKLREAAVQPLMNEGSFATNCGSCILLLFQSFTELEKNAAENAYRLWHLIRHRCENGATTMPLLQDVKHQLELNRKYCNCFCDVLAINGFALCMKVTSSLWKQVSQKVKEMMGDGKGGGIGGSSTKGTLSAERFQHLMEEPIRRMTQYKKLFANLAQQNKQRDRPFRCEQEVAGKWAALLSEFSLNKEVAERTRAFWDTCSPKIADQLKTPARRVLRDSKSYHVSLVNAGRFASHWFILFNDIFVHSQYSGLNGYDLSLVWVDPVVDLEGDGTAFALTFPEEAPLTLVCCNAHDKTDWVKFLNDAINAHLGELSCLADQSSRILATSTRRTPPLVRHASYTFTKLTSLKDALYTGSWLCGKVQGRGELVWPDGDKYVGNFKQNLRHGQGTYTVRKGDGETIYDGTWKNGKLNGLGSIRFPNGDTYDGYFKNGVRHGHGVFKHGQFLSTAASVYIGQWANDLRQGYGVTDDISRGEKYMGMWHEGCRQGKGSLVTLDGIYYEGTFVQDKMTGFGLVYEDGSWYEGELAYDGTFSGKGLLTLSSGDTIDGTFTGSWSTGIKVNGTYIKSPLKRIGHEPFYPKIFGSLCVPSDHKWVDIFQHCHEMLCIGDSPIDRQKVWEAIAVTITAWKKTVKQNRSKQLHLAQDLNVLERIPHQESGPLTLEKYTEIKNYLSKAFESPYHPLGKLMSGLVDVYRATYVGIGAHSCLLSYAVSEVHSFVSRIYDIVRVLFPNLPTNDEELLIEPENIQGDDLVADDCETVTASGLILPILLPKIYPPLFTLYALHNIKDDEMYWETLLKWNKQPDVSLMAFLQVDQKFWMPVATTRTTCEDNGSPQSSRLSYVREVCYAKAVDTLQHISTTFSPQDKLRILQCAFEEINNEAQSVLGLNYTWTMDDLFPVFQYVVVRARIRHLGSEVHLIDDLMEARLQNGELGIMFTMLRACYFQVKNERSLTI